MWGYQQSTSAATAWFNSKIQSMTCKSDTLHLNVTLSFLYGRRNTMDGFTLIYLILDSHRFHNIRRVINNELINQRGQVWWWILRKVQHCQTRCFDNHSPALTSLGQLSFPVGKDCSNPFTPFCTYGRGKLHLGMVDTLQDGAKKKHCFFLNLKIEKINIVLCLFQSLAYE